MTIYDADNDRQIAKSYTIDSASTWEKKKITFEGDTTGTLDNDNNASFQFNFWLAAGSNYSSGTLQTSWGSRVDANRAVGQVNLADNTSNEWYITGVQLEVGEQATPFEHRSYGEELALCRRYCTALMHYGAGDVTGNGLYNADYNGNTNMSFIRMGYTQMRENPNITYGSNATVQTDYSSNGLIQFFLGSSVNWRIYDVLLESEL